jgi:hypothetical protein
MYRATSVGTYVDKAEGIVVAYPTCDAHHAFHGERIYRHRSVANAQIWSHACKQVNEIVAELNRKLRYPFRKEASKTKMTTMLQSHPCNIFLIFGSKYYVAVNT